MKKREIEKLMEVNGFYFYRRNGGGHPIYFDGITKLATYSGKATSWRAEKNLLTEINKAVAKRQLVAQAPPTEEREMDSTSKQRFNDKRLDAHIAPGAIKPLSNGHVKEPLPAAVELGPPPVKRKKYDPITKRKLENRIIALYAEGKHEASDVHRALISEGFPDAHGDGLIGIERARYFLNMLLETGVIKQVVVAPRIEPQPVAAVQRGPSRMPDTCVGILTDPSLTAEQKVRMLMAYVEL